MKSIAVLLTVFNRKAKTLEALQNLFTQEIPDEYVLDVYLVDDGCTDGTAQAVAESYPLVHVITSKGDLFWNRGMLLAWESAANAKPYDFYVWLNDDTILNAQALTTLLQTSESKSNKSIVVGTTSSLKDAKTITYGGRAQNGQLVEPKKLGVSCAYFNGNIVLIPKYVYEKVGTNDPVFHHALGDFDYGKRAKKLGIENIVAPGVLGQCDTHESLATWCNPEKPLAKRWQAFRSPLGNNPEEFFIYEKRHGGLFKATLHYMTNHLRVVCPQLWLKK
ncbi:glycosyltransferase family 2 protein [Zobellia amurskyensis]|uniref:Glycosyltransferase family 2 protein n=1 Tax=Zobellia amurskyensis TaxID=248905 RepID=A0A7X2ZX95_9FLAO|nr:glycosyltransferase family 2 protein [Zobellia amurskyensis]